MPPILVALRRISPFALLATSLFMLPLASALGQTALPASPETDGTVTTTPAPQRHLAPATPRAERPEPIPGKPLAWAERIHQKYLQEGGAPGASYVEQRAFLKAKGLMGPDDVGFVKAFQGEITFSRDRMPETFRVTGTDPVLFRDFDETGFDSQIEMQFDDGSTLAMGENTGLKIDEMIYDPNTGKRKVSLSLPVGTVRIKASKNLNPDSALEIRTPLLVAGLRGTEFIIQVDETGRTRVITLEGAVAVRRHRPGEPRPAPKLSATDLSALGTAPANEVMVVAGMMTEALPGRGDSLRARIARVNEIRTAIQATVVKQTPVGLEKKAEKALPAGLAKKETPGDLPPGLEKKDDSKEVPPGLDKKETSGDLPPGLTKKDDGKEVPPGLVKKDDAQTSPPSAGQSRIQARRGAAHGFVNPSAGNSAKAPPSQKAVPVAATGTTHFKAKTLTFENTHDVSRTMPRMANQEAKSLAKETADETVKALAQAAAKKSGKAITRAIIQEASTSAAKETAIRSAKEQASTAAKEQVSNSAKQTAQEAASTTAKEQTNIAAKEQVSNSAKQAAQEAASTAAKEQANIAAKEQASNSAKQTAAQAAQEAASTAAKEQANNAVQEAANKVAKENSSNAAKENANQASKDQRKGK